MQLQFYSMFYGWRPITKEQALNWAKWAINAITTTKSDQDTIQIINNRLKGIQFTVQDLK